MVYEEFLEANPTPQSRIEALTSGILTPDTKAAVILAMDPEDKYTSTRLHKRVRGFGGVDPDLFPLSAGGAWTYCNGNPNRPGSLDTIGAVLKTHIVPADTPIGQRDAVAYQKTDAGSDFGDPAAALGIALVNELVRQGKPAPLSLLRIIGAPQKGKDRNYRRGYAVYKIIEHLALNPDITFRRADIVEHTGLNDSATGIALNSLGLTGVIHYVSPQRDQDGKSASGWSVYRSETVLDFETCLADIRGRSPGFSHVGYLRSIIDYLNEHIGEEVESNRISKDCNMSKGDASQIISNLATAGHLAREYDPNARTHTRANEFTMLLWSNLLGPIGRVAESMDPEEPGFSGRLLEYRMNSDLLRAHLEALYRVYTKERTHPGRYNSELCHDLVEVLRSAGKPLKRSQILSEVNAAREQRGLLGVSLRSLISPLKDLARGRDPLVERVDKGMYAARIR